MTIFHYLYHPNYDMASNKKEMTELLIVSKEQDTPKQLGTASEI